MMFVGMASIENGGAPSPSTSTTGQTAVIRRKHRAGFRRTQIACERCRSRKNKCDGKLPECSACERAGVPCVIVDRLTWKEKPRGHVEELEAEVKRLEARVRELEVEVTQLRNGVEPSQNEIAAQLSPLEQLAAEPTPEDVSSTIAQDIDLLSQDVISERKYIGESSGVFFGHVLQTVLLRANYKHDQNATHKSFGLQIERPSSALSASSAPCRTHVSLPLPDMAETLLEAFFTNRWPSLPFLHRPSFLEKHYSRVMSLGYGADPVSLFLTLMVFALGAIDLRRRGPDLTVSHLDYFTTATTTYLYQVIERDNIETVQGLLLMAVFAINEPRSVNAWHVAGQAVRMAIDLGLHRTSTNNSNDLQRCEMKKRVFWSAYAMDRNISVALGRPFAIRDADISASLPLRLTDDDLVAGSITAASCGPFSTTPMDMSTFIHVVKLRQLNSKTLDVFYPADATNFETEFMELQRTSIRAELDEWIRDAPRYCHPAVTTFQSTEWFQIAYSHALLLLYRPSPSSPIPSLEGLQLCAEAAINLISSYSSLYAKNKITYTWIALHSLFMASITMLYTLWTSPEMRRGTNKAVVRSNVMSCLALFEVISGTWPLATRCHEIVERLGNATITLFETPSQMTPGVGEGGTPSRNEQHLGEITAEFMDWFAAHPREGNMAGDGLPNIPLQRPTTEEGDKYPDFHFSSLPDLDDLFRQGFDMNLPITMDAFDQGNTTC